MSLDPLFMRTTPPPRTGVYLLRRRPQTGVFASVVNPFFIGDLIERPVARLELTDQTVRCTLVPKRKLKHVGWLARRLQIPDLPERVKTGDEVPVFEFPRSGYQINWPQLSMGTLFEISDASCDPWIVSFGMPRDYGHTNVISNLLEMSDFLKMHERQQWRAALSPSGPQDPRVGNV